MGGDRVGWAVARAPDIKDRERTTASVPAVVLSVIVIARGVSLLVTGHQALQ
jgi:hypothetical protein